MAKLSKTIIFAATILCTIVVAHCGVANDYSGYAGGTVDWNGTPSIIVLEDEVKTIDDKKLIKVKHFYRQGDQDRDLYVRFAPNSNPAEVTSADADCKKMIKSYGQGILKKKGKPDVDCTFFVVRPTDTKEKPKETNKANETKGKK